MRSLRGWSIGAILIVLCAAPLSAQSGKVSCKDGSKPKSGHFSCWGHGGLVAANASANANKAAKTEKAAKKAKAKSSGTKARGSTAKADKKKPAKKAHAKRSTK